MAEAYANACSGKRTSGLPGEGRTKKAARWSAEEDFSSRLAWRVRQTYIVERDSYESLISLHPERQKYRVSRRDDGGPNWDDSLGEYPEGQVHKSVWQKIVVTLFKEQIDPVDYIRCVFAAISGWLASPPLPRTLLSKRYRRIYKDYLETAGDELDLALRIQRNLAENLIVLAQVDGGVSMEEAVEEVLVNDRLALSSLFRYCLAVSMKGKRFTRLAERYRVGAAVQYVRQAEDYTQAWGDFIPEHLRTEAEKIYRRVLKMLS